MPMVYRISSLDNQTTPQTYLLLVCYAPTLNILLGIIVPMIEIVYFNGNIDPVGEGIKNRAF